MFTDVYSPYIKKIKPDKWDSIDDFTSQSALVGLHVEFR